MAHTQIKGGSTTAVSQIKDGSIYKLQIASGQVIFADGTQALTGDWNVDGHKITGLPTPTADSDAATKAYVDSVAQGIDVKGSCRASTTGALPSCTYSNGNNGVGATLTASANGALPSQDGVTLVVNDRLLVKNQASPLQNGIYKVTQIGDSTHPWILTRVTDFDEGGEVPSGFTFIEEGTTNADSGWVCTTNAPVTMGTTDITFTQFTGAGQITAGTGLTKSGNTIHIGDGTTGNVGGINRTADDISVATGNGLALSSNLVIVKADTTGGGGLARAINVSSNGVAVKIDNTTIGENGSNQLYLKDGAVSTSKIVDSAVTEPKLDCYDSPSNGEVLSWNATQGKFEWITQTAADDKKVKVTTNDTTPDFLDAKIGAGNGLTKSVGNAGGNEILNINVGGGDGISVGADAISVNLSSTGGLEFSSGAIKIKQDGTTGGNSANVIKLSANGASIGIDNDTIKASSNNLYVNSSVVAVLAKMVIGEDHSAQCNGTNTQFSFNYNENQTYPGIKVFLNGVRQLQGSGNDYTYTPGTPGYITMATAPASGDILLIDYIKS